MSAWNHNTHQHQRLLRLLPQRGGSALDVGAGDGIFARRLAERFTEVLALENDEAQAAGCAALLAGIAHVRVERGDFLTSGLPDGSFDVVTALAAFHHMPFEAAATEARRVLKPGGRLVVLGVWTDTRTSDLPWNVASVLLNRRLQKVHGRDTMDAPSTFERTSWPATVREARQHLPGARLRRHLLWRYTLVWTKPLSE